MNKSDFSNRVEMMIDELYEAFEYYCGYVHMHKKLETDLNVMNWFPGFFQLTLKSFLELFVLKLSRLYDDNKESITLNKISGWIEQNKEIREGLIEPMQTIEEINMLLADHKKEIDALKVLRDKFLAHADKKQLTKNIWKDANISMVQYRNLISLAHEVLSLCCIALDRTTPALGMGVENEIDDLIKTIKNSKAYLSHVYHT